MVVPTCNFYHFLVSFASQARPEDIHKERAKETEWKWGGGGDTTRSKAERKGEKAEEQRSKGRQNGGHCHGGTHLIERVSSGEIKVWDREGNNKDMAKKKLKTRKIQKKREIETEHHRHMKTDLLLSDFKHGLKSPLHVADNARTPPVINRLPLHWGLPCCLS